MIPHSRPFIDAEDVRSVEEVLRSGHLAGGEKVATFEDKVARFLGQKGGVAVSSGTAGLHLALLGLGVEGGDAVAIPSYACAALLQAVEHVGAKPVLVDFAPSDYNLDLDDLRRKRRGLAAVITVHTFGRVCDLGAVRDAAAGIPIIEDCAQAIGDPGVGDGDAVVCSFYATKMMTTGEGGMVLSNNRSFLADVRDRREYDEKPRHRPRYNYKMTDVQAALGLSQLRKLPWFVLRRRELSRRYGREERTCFRFVVSTGTAASTIRHFQVQGIRARRPVYKPLHRYGGLPDGEFPGTAKAMKRFASVPLYPALKENEVRRIVRVLESLEP